MRTMMLVLLAMVAFNLNALEIPGVVIQHAPATGKIYLGSPGIAVLPDGNYVAKCDEFGPGSTAETQAMTQLFISTNRGKNWLPLRRIEGSFWASIFVHADALYLMGTDKASGNVVIRKSLDGGVNWTEPVDSLTGRILNDGDYHTAPVPVVIHDHRIWRAFEDAKNPGGWGYQFRAFMMSAPVDADLLNSHRWTCSNRLGRSPEWLEGQFGGWLEGNAVVTPAGKLVNILRVDYRQGAEKAAVIAISADGQTATFDPQQDFIDFPGGCKKFTIRFDPVSQKYWALSNPVLPQHRQENPERTRNALALLCSPDLRQWEMRSIVLYHPDVKQHGFQYPDWLFDGQDLITVIRVAFDDESGGAHNQHDANYLLFYRIKNFRHKTMKDSAKGARPGELAWQAR
ncbi:glycoside hydrolase [candidate division KSB1 bacterium]|nr:glycoside hydrolase [candidate division KSB1 bacterium]